MTTDTPESRSERFHLATFAKAPNEVACTLHGVRGAVDRISVSAGTGGMTDPPAYMLIIAAGGEDPMSRSLISAEEAQAIAAVLDHHRKGYGKNRVRTVDL